MSTPIEEKKEGKWLGDYGDIKGFFKDVLTYIIYVILWGLGGAFVITLVTTPSRNIVDGILPTDCNMPPYKNGVNKCMTANDVFKDTDDAGTSLHRVLEFMYPMECASFPYESWLLHKENIGSISTIAKSFSLTCAYVFRLFRGWYKTFLVTMNGIIKLSPNYGEPILFYILPFLLVAFHVLPILPFIGFFSSFIGSVIENVPNSYYLLFPPLGAIIYGMVTITGGEQSWMNPMNYIVAMGAFFISFGVMFAQWWWYFFIGIALWVYGIMFFLFSPLAQKDGTKIIKTNIQNHWKGLTSIFLLFVFLSSKKHLSSTLTTGIIIGILISLYKIYKA